MRTVKTNATKKNAGTAEVGQDKSYQALIQRSYCSIQKKDAPTTFPEITSANQDGAARWAHALFLELRKEDKKDKNNKSENGENVVIQPAAYFLAQGDLFCNNGCLPALPDVEPLPSADNQDPATADAPPSFASFFNGLSKSAGMIGNVGFRAPNPLVSTPSIFVPRAPVCDDKPFLVAGMLQHDLLYSDNPNRTSSARFLLAKVIVDGVQTTVIEALLDDPEGIVAKSLRSVGISDEQLKNIAAAYRQKKTIGADLLHKEPIHAMQKQVFFEEDGEDPVIIIPVVSNAMIAALRAVTKGKPDLYIPGSVICKIGGANAQNAGIIGTDTSGAFELLMASPPEKRSQSLAKRLAHGGRLYNRWAIDRKDVETFVSQAVIEQQVSVLEERKAEARLYRWFAEILVSPLVEADEMLSSGTGTHHESGAIAQFLNRDRSLRLDENHLHLVAQQIIEGVALFHSNFHIHAASSVVQRLLTASIVKELL